MRVASMFSVFLQALMALSSGSVIGLVQRHLSRSYALRDTLVVQRTSGDDCRAVTPSDHSRCVQFIALAEEMNDATQPLLRHHVIYSEQDTFCRGIRVAVMSTSLSFHTSDA